MVGKQLHPYMSKVMPLLLNTSVLRDTCISAYDLSHIYSSDIVTNSPFSRETLALDVKQLHALYILMIIFSYLSALSPICSSDIGTNSHFQERVLFLLTCLDFVSYLQF